MTTQERKLWYMFLRSHNTKFYRQKPLGDFIADFYCAKVGLVIEIDGGGHYEDNQIEKDSLRTKYLNKLNLTVIRFTNTDIDKNFENVCNYIDHIVNKLSNKNI